MKLNTGLLLIGCASVGSHLVILVAMFLANGRRFVSEYMMDIIWYCATITMLFLIEHAVWLYVLWVVSRPPFWWRLGVAYFGVLVACVSWVMEVVVPMVPNVGKLHSIFCMIFIVGCLINLVASVLLVLPGKVQGVVLLLPPSAHIRIPVSFGCGCSRPCTPGGTASTAAATAIIAAVVASVVVVVVLVAPCRGAPAG